MSEERRCPICAAAANFNATNVGGRWLLRCALCRHMFWRDDVTEAELAIYYARAYTEHHDQASIQQSERHYYSRHVLELEQMLRVRPIECLVDFGCSVPVCLEEARRRGYARIIGVDYGEQALSAGRAQGLEMLTPQDFFERVSDNVVDVIRFSHVIEHMRDPVMGLDRIVEKVARGGIVYITQPIFPALRADAYEFPYADAVFPEHLHFFSPVSLLKLVLGCGLEIEEFFAFQNVDGVQERYANGIDRHFVESQVSADTGRAPPGFDPRGGRPDFLGENCRIVARKP